MQPSSLPMYRYTSTRCYVANSYIGKSVHLLLGQTTYTYIHTQTHTHTHTHHFVFRTASHMCLILRGNCLLGQVIDAKTKLKRTIRQGRRRKQLMGDTKEKEHILRFERESITLPRRDNRFGRGYGPIARETTSRINISVVYRELDRSH